MRFHFHLIVPSVVIETSSAYFQRLDSAVFSLDIVQIVDLVLLDFFILEGKFLGFFKNLVVMLETSSLSFWPF